MRSTIKTIDVRVLVAGHGDRHVFAIDKSETDETNFIGMTNLLETTCPVNISLPLPPEESKTTRRNMAIVCILFALELISGVGFFWGFVKYRDMAQTLGLEFLPAGGPKRFTFTELKAATNDFSNLISKGGFGDVYKGKLGSAMFAKGQPPLGAQKGWPKPPPRVV